MSLVDLSAPIEPSPPETPDPLRTDIEFADHTAGAEQIETLLGVPKRLLREGEGWATNGLAPRGKGALEGDEERRQEREADGRGDHGAPGGFW